MELRCKQWRRGKEHISIDKRPYQTLRGRIEFLGRYLMPAKASDIRIARIFKDTTK